MRPLWASNISIIVASFNAAVFAKDAVEYTKNVTRYLHYILFALLFAIVLLGFRYFYKDHREIISQENQPNDLARKDSGTLEKSNEVSHDIDNKHREEFADKSYSQSLRSENERPVIDLHKDTLPNEFVINRNVFNHPFWKITIGLVISSVILIMLSGIILFRSQVYYVVLRNHIQTEQEANDLVRMANQALQDKGIKNLKASRLYKGKQANQYLVTINGGYLMESEAQDVRDLLLSNGFNQSITPEVKPSNAAFFRKLVYLNQLFSNE